MHKVFYELCHYSPDSASLSVAAICSGFLVVGVRTTGVLAFVFPEELIFPEGTTVGSSGSIVLSSNGVDTLMVVNVELVGLGGCGSVATLGDLGSRHLVTSQTRRRTTRPNISFDNPNEGP